MGPADAEGRQHGEQLTLHSLLHQGEAVKESLQGFVDGLQAEVQELLGRWAWGWRLHRCRCVGRWGQGAPCHHSAFLHLALMAPHPSA